MFECEEGARERARELKECGMLQEEVQIQYVLISHHKLSELIDLQESLKGLCR
jgi:hypothetical protein